MGTATLSILDHELPYDTHNLYDVVVSDQEVPNDTQHHEIRTIVTHTPSFVDTWISDIHSSFSNNCVGSQNCFVGLDVEWRPCYGRYDNPVATLQLCCNHQCLIFQFLHSPFIPQSLAEFLTNGSYTFVGVGIDSDVEKLHLDYNLSVTNTIDLRQLAANATGDRSLCNAGLKTLGSRVLGLEVDKPRRITMSRWDHKWLTPAQVQYACVDAFLSDEIGVSLNAAGYQH